MRGCLGVLLLGLVVLLLLAAGAVFLLVSPEQASAPSFRVYDGPDTVTWQTRGRSSTPAHARDLTLDLSTWGLVVIGLPLLLGAVAVLAIVLIQRRSAPQRRLLQAEDAELLRGLRDGLSKLDNRVEALETILLATDRPDARDSAATSSTTRESS